jgi:hypothetical protein
MAATVQLKTRGERTEPLVIYRSVDGSGATYALDWRDRERLKKRFGEAVHLPPRVFIAHETEADEKSIRQPLRRQIAQLLTGLAEERLMELGPIQFRDPVTERLIR